MNDIHILGWTREHVLRGTPEEYSKFAVGTGKKASDVYYFTPDGRKLVRHRV